MYAVGALGKQGGDHVMTMFTMQLKQIMEQLGCEDLRQLPGCLLRG